MSQRRPKRKKRLRPPKPKTFDPIDRAVRHRVGKRWVKRRKQKKGYQERKALLLVILGFAVAFAILIIFYNVLRTHDEGLHH